MKKEVPDYARYVYVYTAHHIRYKRFVESMPRKLVCQDCGGAGGEKISITDYGDGPWESCGWCEGTGYVTPWLRGIWLQYRREEKRAKANKTAGSRI